MPIYNGEEQTNMDQKTSSLQTGEFIAGDLKRSVGNTAPLGQQSLCLQDQGAEALMEGGTNRGVHPHEAENMKDGLSGAAFNTTPIYDAKGSLVGLQTSLDTGNVEEMFDEPNNPMGGYASIPQEYQYTMRPIPSGSPGIVPEEYIPYGSYSTNQTPLGYPTMTYHPQLHQPMQRQVYPANMCLLQDQQQQHQHQHQQQQQHPLLPHKHMLLANSNSANTGAMGQASVVRGLPVQSFDRCPTVCSLFAILCCPITLWCSLPALAYSLCAYADYRAGDYDRCNRKSDLARHLVITACVVGLLLCIAWAVLAFFYYDLMLATVNDVLRTLNQRIRYGR